MLKQKQPNRIYTVDRPIKQRIKTRLFRQEWVRQMLRPFVRLPAERQWVFIIGCYNSGTTMLHDMIANHKQCASLPAEGVALTSHLIRPEELGWTRLWWKVYDQMQAFTDESSSERLAEQVKKDWAIIYDTRQPVFLEKSVSNVVRIPWLAKHFPNALFISIVRNGYAVAEGIQRKSKKSGLPLPNGLTIYPIAWCAQQWLTSNQLAEVELGKLPQERVLQLTYEQFCDKPADWLEKTGQFIGLDDVAAQPTEHIRNMNASSINRLSVSDKKEINQVAAEMLRHYGYPILDFGF